ncbi:sensor histidine kinase [Billgrantia sp. LNSP4103-1]|uniref:sensor histidine kinase n=1 Tax=Billgrantia sp. LNSP4103-1 TaxID=3410266 RepID=UPI00403F6EF9
MRFAKMPLNSISLKVLLAYVTGMVLSITLLMLAAFVLLQSDVLKRMDLADAAEGLVNDIEYDSEGRPVGIDSRRLEDLAWLFDGPQRETAYRILDNAGNVAAFSSMGEAFWPADDHLWMGHDNFTFEHEGIIFYCATESFEHAGRTWYLQFAASARLVDLLHSAALPLVVAGVAAFGFVLCVTFGLCAFITLRYTLKPLRDVSESAAAISPHSIDARLKSDVVPAEITPLVDSFNRALECLERGYRVQQEFLGQAAHELKTPLALIRAQIELREDGKDEHDSLLSDVEYMTRQVQQLLLLVETSEVYNYHFAEVPMQEVAREVVSFLDSMAEAVDVRLVVRAAGDVIWRADHAACFTLLKNLLENAIQHSPARTTVCVEIEGETLTVRDKGPGVEPEQLSMLFERFWRAPHRRDHGAGLGLTICKEIALAHGWQLTAEQAEPGLRFRVANAKGGRALVL